MRYVRSVQADHCILLELNIFQLVLGLFRGLDQVEVSGILFFPYPRIDPDGQNVIDRLLCWFEKLRKHVQLRWMLRNRDIETVFLLNDGPAVEHLNQFWPERTPFRMLPDPVPPLAEELMEEEGGEEHETIGEQSRKQSEGVPRAVPHAPHEESKPSRNTPRPDGEDRIVFLMFGALRKEKGIREVIHAFRQLSPGAAKNATLWLFGQVSADLEDEFPDLVELLRRERPNLHVQVETRFLPERELHEALQGADVVLAPYLRSEGSSGVIGHSARYRVPVLGPKSGLVGSLIDEHDLGITVEANDPKAIVRAVHKYIKGELSRCETPGMQRYVEQRTPTRFAQIIFDAVLDGNR